MSSPVTTLHEAFTTRNGFHQFDFKSYKDFISLVDSSPALFKGDYVFRGQREALWRLEPSLTRALREVPREKHAQLRRRHLIEFCKLLRGLPDIASPDMIRRVLEQSGELHTTTFSTYSDQPVVRDIMVQDEVDVWSLGQHFDLNTPLLDWSRTFSYALFFAASSERRSEGSSCAVYALNKEMVRMRTAELRKQPDAEHHGFLDLVEPINGERRRIMAQNGLFSICSSNLPVERWVTSSFSRESQKHLPVLLKFIFPSAYASECMQYLGIHGITHSRMMPDLQGVCKEVNHLLKGSISHV